MTLTLTVRSGHAETPSITFDSPKVVIGRSAGADLVLPDPSVSLRHASIRQRGGEYIVLDEGSTNGTFIGPVRLSPGTPRVLVEGDLIRLGRVWVEAALRPAAPTPNPRQLTKQIALQLVESALEQEGEGEAHPFLVVESNPEQRLVLARFSVAYVVGRGKKCDLVLEDEDCSRRHIEVRRRGAQVLVVDLGSKNGSQWNGHTLVPKEETAWEPGSTLLVGNTRLTLHDPVHQTYAELEAAPDEIVHGTVDPPDREDASDPEEPDVLSSRPAVPSTAAVREMPRRAAPPRTTRRAGWAAMDWLIAGLALVVLGLSAAGLLWLLGG